MLRSLCLVLCLSCLFAGESLAQFSATKLIKLDKELHQLISAYPNQVGICFIDLESGRELQINGRWKFPAASIAKLPVMATVYHLSEINALDLDETIELQDEDKVGGSGLLRWIRTKRQYRLRDLARLMIVSSDNTASHMLVKRVGLENINAYMNNGLSLCSISITDPTMLLEPTSEAANTASPADTAYLLARIQDGPTFSSEARAEMLGYLKQQRYRWGLRRGLPAGTMVADKTGNHNKVMNNAGIIYSPAGDYILSVFTFGLEDKNAAQDLIRDISQLVYKIFTGEDEPAKMPRENPETGLLPVPN
ncbi:MAG: serine hydrolase [Candidatus Saganbacteria bacterium]|nr:serine hydrolase [Candidatus Saganbacteria bacterium]